MLTVLRMGHRLGRYERLSTHMGLTARALGADGIIYTGEKDNGLLQSVAETAKRWGGNFTVSYEEDWKAAVKSVKRKGFKLVHLTMYGEPLQKKIMIAAGSAKVPGQMYLVADYNIAVGSQPHSEVAALAVFLHEYFKGKELDKTFPKAKLVIEPQARGKRVASKD